MVRVPDRVPKPIPPGTRISHIFEEQAGALLILGAPGTGKTTFLLELTQDLLDRADQDDSQPIPVVFPLSSWAARRQPLAEWLVTELNQRSYVPKKVARRWVKTEQILPLLDGLDEVAAEHRKACVDAINQFRREHGLLPIAVCSRIADYEALGTKLRLRTAVEVQPLTKSQIGDYLAYVGEPLRGLRSAVEADESLWEPLETPLMLWVAMLAYRDVPIASVPGNTVEQRQRQLFAHFVEAMFRRRPSQRRHTAEQTT
ncbi:MAG: NACHT domain-containing protein [Catenulispora sp.]